MPLDLKGADPYDAILAGEEVRVTSETGGQKGSKLAQLGAVDPAALLELAKVAGFGGEKYERYNYLRGFDWSLSYDAMMRHAMAFWSGEDIDPESGLPHMAHCSWHALALISFASRGIGTDDRASTYLRNLPRPAPHSSSVSMTGKKTGQDNSIEGQPHG